MRLYHAGLGDGVRVQCWMVSRRSHLADSLMQLSMSWQAGSLWRRRWMLIFLPAPHVESRTMAPISFHQYIVFSNRIAVKRT